MISFCTGKFRRAISILLCLPALSAFSQQKKYSLKDLVDSAQHHLPALLQKQALVEAAKAGVTDARHAYLPTSYIGDELTVSTDNSIPGSYISFGIIPSSSSGVRPANTYQSALGNIGFFYNQYELLDFGLKKATVRNAQAYLQLTQADRDRQAYLIKWEVAKLYLDVLKSEYQLAIDQQNVNRYDTIFTVIRAVTESGIRPGADSSLAKAELSKTRITYNQTFGVMQQQLQQLSYLSGIPAQAIRIDTAGTRSYLPLSGGLSNMPMDTALNPLVEFFNKERALYQEREELVKKSYLPRVLLNGVAWARGSGIDYTNNYKESVASGLGYQRFNYLSGLTLQYDLFNIVHRRDKERIARNNSLASEYGFQQQQLSLQNAASKADEAIYTANRNLGEIPVQIGAAEDAFNQKTAQYKAGIINLVDLTNASFVLYRSQSDYVQTLSDWLLASLDKFSTSGSLDQFIQSIK
jgi:outer membrane protein TolC